MVAAAISLVTACSGVLRSTRFSRALASRVRTSGAAENGGHGHRDDLRRSPRPDDPEQRHQRGRGHERPAHLDQHGVAPRLPDGVANLLDVPGQPGQQRGQQGGGRSERAQAGSRSAPLARLGLDGPRAGLGLPGRSDSDQSDRGHKEDQQPVRRQFGQAEGEPGLVEEVGRVGPAGRRRAGQQAVRAPSERACGQLDLRGRVAQRLAAAVRDLDPHRHEDRSEAHTEPSPAAQGRGVQQLPGRASRRGVAGRHEHCRQSGGQV